MLEPTRCPYELLGVARTASSSDIKRAYKFKALEYHPDKNKNGGEMFKQINAAYAVVGNEKRKAEYDMLNPVAGKIFNTWDFPSGSQTARTQTHDWAQPPSNPRPPQSARGGSYRSHVYMSTLNEKELEEKIKREQKEFKERQRFQQGGLDFGAWYRQKMDDFDEAEVAAQNAARQRKEEEERKAREAKAERERAIAKAEEDRKDAERRKAAAKAAEEAIRRDVERKKAEKKEKEARERAARELREQQAAAAEADRNLEALRLERENIRLERERLANVMAGIPSIDPEKARELREARELRSQQLQEEQVHLNNLIVRMKQDAQEAARQEVIKARQRREDEEAEARKEKEKEQKATHAEQILEEHRRQAEADRRKRYLELERKSRAFMDEIQTQKMKHREDLLRMRAETDRMEEEARAALNAMRAEKQKLGLVGPSIAAS